MLMPLITSINGPQKCRCYILGLLDAFFPNSISWKLFFKCSNHFYRLVWLHQCNKEDRIVTNSSYPLGGESYTSPT